MTIFASGYSHWEIDSANVSTISLFSKDLNALLVKKYIKKQYR